MVLGVLEETANELSSRSSPGQGVTFVFSGMRGGEADNPVVVVHEARSPTEIYLDAEAEAGLGEEEAHDFERQGDKSRAW